MRAKTVTFFLKYNTIAREKKDADLLREALEFRSELIVFLLELLVL